MAVKKITLVEYPNLKLCENVWKHPNIDDADRSRIKNYCDRALKMGSVTVDYNTKYEYGRYYVSDPNSHSACPMPSKVRATLFSEKEFDVDIVNCHPNILLEMFEEHYPESSSMYPQLTHYINNRDDILKSFKMKDHGIAKALFPILMYGGGIQTWEREFEINSNDYELPPFVDLFHTEMKILTAILLNNPSFKTVSQSFRSYKKAQAKKKHYAPYYKNGKLPKNAPKFDEEAFDVHDGKKLSAIIQEKERVILVEALKFSKNQGVDVTAYCYDGFQIIKQDLPSDFIADLNSHIQTHFGKRIEFIIKPFKTPLDMNLIQDCGRFNMKEFQMIDDYCAKKDYFEKFHFKCLQPPCFVRTCEDQPPQLITLSNFPKLYTHLTIPGDRDGERTSFVSEWCVDASMRIYDTIDILPPPLSCPDYTYNGWVDFPIKKVSLDPSADTSRVYQHLDYVSNHNPLVKEYLLNWFAQMVQFPAHKSRVAILLQGLPGSGKSVISEKLMERIIGSAKMRVTCKLDKILGKHSDNRGKLLTVMNEMGGKESFSMNELLLDYITAETTEIEPKGIDAFAAKAYDRMIATTNSINSIKIASDDRRWVAISVDSSVKNNKEYFTALYKDLEDDVVMRKFYEDLMNRPLSKWDPINDRPITELTETMNELNADPVDLFEDYIREKYHKEVEHSASWMYLQFKNWWSAENRDPTHLMTRTKFGVVFKRRPSVVFKKTSTCNVYIFTDGEYGE